MKPKVYLETSVVSYLTSRPSRDLITAGRQKITNDWWESEKINYKLFISETVISEAKLGDIRAVKKRMSIINKLNLVELTADALKFAQFLIEETPFPKNAKVDALYIAIAAIHGMDYLLTWNFKHIANASIRSKIEVLSDSKNITLPVICTPEELIY